MWNFQGTNRFLRGGFDPQIIDIIKYNNQTGYTVDIDVFLDNELSDLTLQVELLYNGKVTIEDLHVL